MTLTKAVLALDSLPLREKTRFFASLTLTPFTGAPSCSAGSPPNQKSWEGGAGGRTLLQKGFPPALVLFYNWA